MAVDALEFPPWRKPHGDDPRGCRIAHLTFACDTHYPWQTEMDEVVQDGRICLVNGCVRIPDKPGLGVELDYDQVARGREQYAKITSIRTGGAFCRGGSAR